MPSSRKIDHRIILTPVDAAKEIWQDLAADNGVYATTQAKVIFSEILPGVLARFVRKNADYKDTAKFLGLRGQFADINPKFWKLKKALWDGEPLIGESVEEILADLVGHALLSLYFLREFSNDAPIDSGKQVVIVPDTAGDLPPGKYIWNGTKWMRDGDA